MATQKQTIEQQLELLKQFKEEVNNIIQEQAMFNFDAMGENTTKLAERLEYMHELVPLNRKILDQNQKQVSTNQELLDIIKKQTEERKERQKKEDEINETEKERARLEKEEAKRLEKSKKEWDDQEKKRTDRNNSLLQVGKSIWNVVSGFVKNYAEQDDKLSKINSQFGFGKEQLGQWKEQMYATASQTAVIGGSLQDILELQSKYTSAIGRTSLISRDAMMNMVAISKIMGSNEAAVQFASSMDDMGASISSVGDYMNKVTGDALKNGVDIQKTAQTVQQNLNLANRYTFKDGITGLSRMAAYSVTTKLNLQEVGKAADKLGTLEGAITASAKLNVLGGSFASGSNPIDMLYQATSDFEGLGKRLQDMFSKNMYLNRQTGVYEASPADKMRMKAAAQELGVDFDEMWKTSVQTNIRNLLKDTGLLGQMKKVGLNESDEDWMLSKARVRTNKETGKDEAVVNVAASAEDVKSGKYGKDIQEGQIIEKAIGELDTKQVQQLRPQEQNIIEIAQTTRGIGDDIRDIREVIYNKLFGWLQKFNNFFGITDKLKWVKEAVGGHAGVVAGGAAALYAGSRIGGSFINNAIQNRFFKPRPFPESATAEEAATASRGSRLRNLFRFGRNTGRATEAVEEAITPSTRIMNTMRRVGITEDMLKSGKGLTKEVVEANPELKTILQNFSKGGRINYGSAGSETLGKFVRTFRGGEEFLSNARGGNVLGEVAENANAAQGTIRATEEVASNASKLGKLSRFGGLIKPVEGIAKVGGAVTGGLLEGGFTAFDEYQKGNFKSDSGMQGTAIGKTAGAAIGATAGALLMSWAGPIGMALGGMAGGWLGKKAGGWIGSFFDKKEDRIKNLNTDEGKAYSKIDAQKNFVDAINSTDDELLVIKEIAKSAYNIEAILRSKFEIDSNNLNKKEKEKLEDAKVDFSKFDTKDPFRNYTVVNDLSDENIGTPAYIKRGQQTYKTHPNDKIIATKPGGPLWTMNNDQLKLSHEMALRPKPVSLNTPSIKTPNYNNNAQSISMQPLDININGTLRLEADGKEIDISQIIKDPTFVRNLTNLISASVKDKNYQGKYKSEKNQVLGYYYNDK